MITLNGKQIKVIGEVKTDSPYKGRGLQRGFGEQLAFVLTNPIFDFVSLHTDPLFGGSMARVKELVKSLRKPVLAKGCHSNLEVFNAACKTQAQTVLQVGTRFTRPLGSNAELLYEPDGLDKLKYYYDVNLICINRRNPYSGETYNLEHYYRAIGEFRQVRPHTPIVQASCITKKSDIHPMVDMVLVGDGKESFLNSVENR